MACLAAPELTQSRGDCALTSTRLWPFKIGCPHRTPRRRRPNAIRSGIGTLVLALVAGLLPLFAIPPAAHAAAGELSFVDAASTAGNRTSHTVRIPATVNAGDALVLYLTTNSTDEHDQRHSLGLDTAEVTRRQRHPRSGLDQDGGRCRRRGERHGDHECRCQVGDRRRRLSQHR